MARDRSIRFGPFALDPANARLYRGDEVVPLRGKTLAVLEYLTARPGQLVTKDELLDALWPGVHVSEDVLVGCVHELRSVFGDTRGAARFVETVYRRGYRWIAGVDAAEVSAPAPVLVGRDADLAQLARWLAQASDGTRQLVFVTGDAGIGKTALVDAFIRTVPATAVVARGQCVEQYGPAEPFLPILDALARVRNAEAAATLARCLPDGLVWDQAAPAPAAGIMPDRAVRMVGAAIEALAVERPFLLVLEDMHWSDASTLDVLSYLARRPEPCRLMILATHRPTDLILRRHPLRDVEQELRTHRRSAQLPLARLGRNGVERWLAARHPSPPAILVDWLYQRTDGHPLFLVTLFDAVVGEGLVGFGAGGWTVEPGYVAFGVPESLRLMIDRQAEQLDEADRRLLEAASVVGREFSAASVAAALEDDVLAVEARCDALARRGQFLRAVGSADWPDGTVAGAYAFLHELYRSTLAARLSPGHARLLHERVGRRLEQGYAERTDDVAIELALHFERAREPARAIQYMESVAAHCARRGAHREAIATLRRALDMAALLPATSERTARKLFLNLRMGASLLVAEDYADPDVEATFERARRLAEHSDALAPLLTALAGLHGCHLGHGRLADAASTAARMVEIADRLPLREAKLIAHAGAAWSNLSRGELAAAREHANQALAARPSEPLPFPSTFDLVGYAFGVAALAEMATGNVAVSRIVSSEGLAWCRKTARPVDVATALALAAMLHASLGDSAAAGAHAGEAVAVAEEHGFRQWRAIGRIIAAWAARPPADVTPLVEDYARLGMRTQLSPFLCLAGDAYLRAGEPARAMEALARAEAHVRESGECWYEAEVHRLRGEMLTATEPRAAEVSFQRAIELAAAQGARLFELRAKVQLATLWRGERKIDAARRLLEPMLASFADGADAPDLQAARAVCARL